VTGDSGVDKCNLILGFHDNLFSESHTSIGTDFRFKTLDLDGKIVKMQTWDQPEADKLKSLDIDFKKMLIVCQGEAEELRGR
jgi:Ras-related protein Rab-1A